MKQIKKIILFSIIQLLAIFRYSNALTLNATGGTFPNSVYQEATFSYHFINPDGDDVSYLSVGSTTGKCNIMGYWHTGNTNTFLTSNTKSRDTFICTDKCNTPSSIATCGNSSLLYPRFDKSIRRPLVHFAGSDSLLSAADYKAFPDLQMLPSVAGAVVPIYNIPELKGYTLVLSRSTIAGIFLGNIKYWNDNKLLADNKGAVATILSSLNKKINVVVRTDSSGTTEIFSTAIASFDPCCISIPDYSFATTAGKGQTPKWCGPLTDEIQTLITTGCSNTLQTSQKIVLNLVGKDYKLHIITINCNATAGEVDTAFESVYGRGTILVTRSLYSTSTNSYLYSIGYWGPQLTTTNWYQPYIISSPPGVTITINTLQEGGYFNSHYNSSAYTILPEMQSIWINLASNVTFNISDPNSNYPNLQSQSISPQTDKNIINTLIIMFKQINPGFITSITKASHTSNSWVEYKLNFNTSTKYPKQPKLFNLHVNKIKYINSVAITRFQAAYNYPLFYDSTHPQGYSGSGKYTCYKHGHNMTAWSYYTGSANKGVLAEVVSMPYSIGYSDLVDATTSNVPKANLINRYGTTVTASGDSVTYAAMELGGSLDSKFNAVLADGASAKCWPMTGYTYFIIRTKNHLGSCEQRKAAMKFLYTFYFSDAVSQIALRLGYSSLPSFIRNIVVSKLIDVAQCNNGEYALDDYRKKSLNILTTTATSNILSTYLSAYYTIDPASSWNITAKDNSNAIWQSFIQSQSFIGAFTMFMSPATKRLQYSTTSFLQGRSTLTTAYAHVAVVTLYHLNAFTSKASAPLYVTADILAKIYTGKIQYWNDTLIKAANTINSKYLPYQRIVVVARTGPTDTNNIYSRYLSSVSNTFQSMYSVTGDDGISTFNFASHLPYNYTIYATDNTNVDSSVTFYDGSIGYYLLTDTPVSSVAYFCRDTYCTNPISPKLITSISACEKNTSTLLQYSSNVNSYDLMFSGVSNCYPLVGTIDYTTDITNNSPTCSEGMEGIANQRAKLSSWLFNGSAMVKPLESTYLKGSNNAIRLAARKKYCDITCSSTYLGYDYCDYRDCSWDSNDYTQSVDSCVASLETRRVSYNLVSNDTCIVIRTYASYVDVFIPCDHVMFSSSTGLICYAICAVGIFISTIILAMGIRKRNDRRLRRSQPLFVFIFLVGSILMNCTVFAYIGENTDVTCMLRPWLYNIALTITYGPLVMKLYTVDKLVHSTKIKKVFSSDTRVFFVVAGMIVLDVIILFCWVVLERPHIIKSSASYAGVLDSVVDKVCTTGSYMKYVMLTYKLMILSVGMFKAITTWHVTAEISEAKQFSVAIAIGGTAYLMNVFIDTSFSFNKSVLLRCVGIFLSGSMSVCLIMIPKFARKKNISALVHPSMIRSVNSAVDAFRRSVVKSSSNHGGSFLGGSRHDEEKSMRSNSKSTTQHRHSTTSKGLKKSDSANSFQVAMIKSVSINLRSSKEAGKDYYAPTTPNAVGKINFKEDDDDEENEMKVKDFR